MMVLGACIMLRKRLQTNLLVTKMHDRRIVTIDHKDTV